MSHQVRNPNCTDNVLVDLGFEDAEELAVKARLALKRNTLIDKRGPRQIDAVEAGERLPPAKQA